MIFRRPPFLRQAIVSRPAHLIGKEANFGIQSFHVCPGETRGSHAAPLIPCNHLADVIPALAPEIAGWPGKTLIVRSGVLLGLHPAR